MEITRNTTVAQLKDFINTNFKAVEKKDKSLADTIKYASDKYNKDNRSVKKAEFADIAKKIINLLGDKAKDATTPAPKLAVVENNTKPQETKSTKTTLKPNKDKGKKEEPKTEEPKAETKGSKMFPADLDIDKDTYTLAEGITTMEDLLKAYEENREFVFAFHWTKGEIKQFYDRRFPVKEFPDDLDLATTLHVSDACKVCYNLSMYTEALYQIMPDAFEVIDGFRYSNGIEFQIYEKR